MSEINELLERYRRGAELVATAAAGAELDYAPEPGNWSVRQILCHMADSEIVGADRFRRVIAEDNPTILNYDQDAWATRLDYHRRKISQALETFRRMRAENHELLKELPETAFARMATHSKRGPISLLDLLRIYTEHAEKHARQILAVRESYKQSGQPQA